MNFEKMDGKWLGHFMIKGKILRLWQTILGIAGGWWPFLASPSYGV